MTFKALEGTTVWAASVMGQPLKYTGSSATSRGRAGIRLGLVPGVLGHRVRRDRRGCSFSGIWWHCR